MKDELLGLVAQYGEPALFTIVAMAAVGLPLPVALLLLIAGSMVSQGVMNLWITIAAGAAGQILGDNAGYFIGRWGGVTAIDWLGRRAGKSTRLHAISAKAQSWGAAGIFLTRWLLTPLGPWINLASGAARYSWPLFLIWDVIGELVCAALYVALGKLFNDRIVSVESIFSDAAWALTALTIAAVIVWKLAAHLKRARE